jgi:trans-AT polyketide synthase/acyltransferase/oxidoreductase domain-containing protein
MYKGIASPALVVALGKAGLLGFLGSGGLGATALEVAIDEIRSRLRPGDPFGVNVVASALNPELELRMAKVLVERSVPVIEAGGFTRVTPSLVLLRLKGARRRSDGSVELARRLMGKVSRVESASLFMQPPPVAAVSRLRESGDLTASEASLAGDIAMADDICVEADSGGHTDQGVAYAIFPPIVALRDRMASERRACARIRIGAAGGIGTPEAVAAAFMLGAQFVLTGSINQCTAEAGTGDAVKDLLQAVDVRDTAYAPAGDTFEFGSRIQVIKRGSLFASRASRLYEIYRAHASLEDLPIGTRHEVEGFMRRSLEEVWDETRRYLINRPERLDQVERDGKRKMAAVFKWYYIHSAHLTVAGEPDGKLDFQIHSGPALGAFNCWARGTPLSSWRNRRVAEIGLRLMESAAEVLDRRFEGMMANRRPDPCSDNRAVIHCDLRATASSYSAESP